LSTFRRDGSPVAVEEVTEWLTELACDEVAGVDGVVRRVVTRFAASSPPHQRLDWGPGDPPLCWGTLVYVGERWRVHKEYTWENVALAWHDAIVAQVRVGDVR
jgi:hypothetical protein